MLKHVAPAHPDASIPDPDRGGFLPPEGRDVSWNPHWAGLAAREDIVVGDVRVEQEEAPPEAPATEPGVAHPDA